MMRYIHTVVVFLMLKTFGWSQQTFHRVYGSAENDHAYSTFETNSGDYILLGTSANPLTLDYDGLAIRTNSDGDTLWCHRYRGTSSDALYCGVEAPNGDLLVAGHTNSFGAAGWSDMWVMRLTASGDTLWTKLYRGMQTEQAVQLLTVASGGFLILGFTFSDTYYKDYSLIRINDFGDTLWTKNYGMSNAVEDPYSIIKTNDGGYLITGSQAVFPLASDVFILKVDSNGNVIWNKTYGGNENDLGFDAEETSDGGFILCGHYSQADLDFDHYLIRTNNLGDTLWTKTYDSSPYGDWARSIEVTDEGGYLIMGYPESFGPTETGITLFKTDNNGQLNWAKTYIPEEGCFNSLAMTQTSDQRYIFLATTYSNANSSYDFMLTKTHENGLTGGCIDSNLTFIATSCPAMVSNATIMTSTDWQVFGTTTLTGNIVLSDSVLCASLVDIPVENLSTQKIELYPNPITNYLYFESEHTIHKLGVYDASGNLLLEFQNPNQADQLNFQSIPTGVYFIQIETSLGTQWQKVIKL